MKRVCSKFVPRLLKDDQREKRQMIARDLFERSCEDLQFLKNIVTSDDSWDRKHQSSQWKGPVSPRLKKRRQVRSKTKVMSLVLFFYSEGNVELEYAPDEQTINKKLYVEVLRRLRESVRRKLPEKWRDGNWILYRHNATAHTSHLVQQFFCQTRHRSVAAAAVLTRSLTV